MPIDVANLLSPDGAIARRLKDFESRPQQVEMAAAVQRAMSGKSRLVVEAGTGVGKSFAYLLPAIKRVVENKERVAPGATDREGHPPSQRGDSGRVQRGAGEGSRQLSFAAATETRRRAS
jgi:ATP-dependent DNA helicase DinG